MEERTDNLLDRKRAPTLLMLGEPFSFESEQAYLSAILKMLFDTKTKSI